MGKTVNEETKAPTMLCSVCRDVATRVICGPNLVVYLCDSKDCWNKATDAYSTEMTLIARPLPKK